MTETTKQILAELSSAASGSGAVLLLSPVVYPRAAIRAAVEAFSEFCELQLDENRDGIARLEVRVRPTCKAEAHRIIGEFQNFLLRAAVEKMHEYHAT